MSFKTECCEDYCFKFLVLHHRALNRFLYSAASGLPDTTDLSQESMAVLFNTHRMLCQQVEHDATPEFLNELKSKICAGYTEEINPEISDLAKIFQDKSLNPLNFPFEYLLNGTLPVEQKEEVVKIQGVSDVIHIQQPNQDI